MLYQSLADDSSVSSDNDGGGGDGDDGDEGTDVLVTVVALVRAVLATGVMRMQVKATVVLRAGMAVMVVATVATVAIMTVMVMGVITGHLVVVVATAVLIVMFSDIAHSRDGCAGGGGGDSANASWHRVKSPEFGVRFGSERLLGPLPPGQGAV